MRNGNIPQNSIELLVKKARQSPTISFFGSRKRKRHDENGEKTRLAMPSSCTKILCSS